MPQKSNVIAQRIMKLKNNITPDRGVIAEYNVIFRAIVALVNFKRDYSATL